MSVTIKGLNELIKSMNALPQKIRDEADKEIEAGAFQINSDAARNIQSNGSIGANGGGLLAGQQVKKETDGSYTVFNDVPYAAFVEFGTGKKVKFLPDWAEVANKFKGARPGMGGDFFDRILAWVKAKNIAGTYSVKTQRRTGSRAVQDMQDRRTAYIIMRSILLNGANPHPFLQPAVQKNEDKIIKNVESAVIRAVNTI